MNYRNRNILLYLTAVQCVIFLLFIIIATQFTEIFDDNYLLKGPNDSRYYYQLALETKNSIIESGLTFKSFFPNDQFPAGISAFLFYIFNTTNILVVLVLTSTLHILTSFIYFLIFKEYFSLKNSWIVTLILHLTPMSAIWYLQHLKESYVCFGFALFTYALLRQKQNSHNVLIILLGFIFIGCAKSYLLIPLIGVFLVIHLYLLYKKYHSVTIQNTAIQLGTLILVTFLSFKFIPSTQGKLLLTTGSKIEKPYTLVNFVPKKIQHYRNAYFQSHNGNLNIDKDVIFENIFDVILYLPRAVYLGFFSPNLINAPVFKDKLSKKVLLERLVTNFMVLIFSFFLIFSYRAKGLILVYLFTVGIFILIFPYIIPNLGTLFRFKSPFYLIYAGLCGCFFLKEINKKRFE